MKRLAFVVLVFVFGSVTSANMHKQDNATTATQAVRKLMKHHGTDVLIEDRGKLYFYRKGKKINL